MVQGEECVVVDEQLDLLEQRSDLDVSPQSPLDCTPYPGLQPDRTSTLRSPYPPTLPTPREWTHR